MIPGGLGLKMTAAVIKQVTWPPPTSVFVLQEATESNGQIRVVRTRRMVVVFGQVRYLGIGPVLWRWEGEWIVLWRWAD